MVNSILLFIHLMSGFFTATRNIMMQLLGPETVKNNTVSGPRNSKNGSEKIMGPETDEKVQFLCPKWLENYDFGAQK